MGILFVITFLFTVLVASVGNGAHTVDVRIGNDARSDGAVAVEESDVYVVEFLG